MMKNTKNKGFTIIEFLLYIGLFSILLFLILQMFASIFEIQIESEATSSVGDDGKYLIQRFTYDINNASDISTPNYYGTSSAALGLVINGENINYSLSSDNLIIENETAGTIDQLNSFGTNVSNVSFVRLNGGENDVVQINFTLTSEAIRKGAGADVRTFQTSIGTR